MKVMRAVRWLVLLAGMGAIAAACTMSDPGPGGFRFTNQTDQPLQIIYIAPDGTEQDEPIIHLLEPGRSIAVTDRFRGNGCVTGTLVARTESGEEIARRSDPICRPGEWVIKQ